MHNSQCTIDCLVYCSIGFGAASTGSVAMPELKIENFSTPKLSFYCFNLIDDMTQCITIMTRL